MKLSLALSLFIALMFVSAQAQTKRRPPLAGKKPVVVQPRENANTAIVVDERLAVLRAAPSLYAMPIQRMRSGKILAVSGAKEADGVTFYRVAAAPPNNFGWVQAEAVVGRFRRGDDERFARLIQASDGFEQIERAMLYLENFPNSALRPAILLLTGDLIETHAQKMSLDAAKKLDKREMAASGAPAHSFFLNYASLDRFRKIGIDFVFNPATKTFHYDGAAWREIVAKFPKNSEADDAQKRLDSLKEKMEAMK